MENLKFLALQYLNDWYDDESDFVADLSSSNDRDARLCCIQKAAKYYKVIRNFKILAGEKRLDKALQALDAVGDSITDENVDLIVCELARTFQLTYGTNAISAASKFLWIRHRSPVVIYDDRAYRRLNKGCGGESGQCDYTKYRREWLKQFAKREEHLRLACAELVRVKDFSLAHAVADEDLERLVGNRWFRERVFDYFLWWNANN